MSLAIAAFGFSCFMFGYVVAWSICSKLAARRMRAVAEALRSDLARFRRESEEMRERTARALSRADEVLRIRPRSDA